MEEPYQVGLFPNNKLRRSVSLAGSTGHIELVLWRERAESVTFNEGDVLCLENVVVSKFNNLFTLTTTFETAISKVDDQMANVAVRSVKRQLSRPSNVVSLNTSIRAVKEFQCTLSCLSCRKTISPDSVEGNLITCPTCSTMFLTERATLNNSCMILLEDNRWFKANTSVSFSALNSPFCLQCTQLTRIIPDNFNTHKGNLGIGCY